MKERENFGSRFAVIMAFAGSAIGLGNIWRFPYLVGQNGGAAFIIIYILASFLLSLPIFLSESVIGRRTHSNTFGAMEALAPGSKWKWMGLLTVISPLVILSFYSVVGGWSIEYFLKSFGGFGGAALSSVSGDVSTAGGAICGVTGGAAGVAGGSSVACADLGAVSISQVSAAFGGFISSTWGPLLCHTAFLLLCALIILAGVKSGIEKFSNITMPILFVLIVLIIIYSLSLPGAADGVRYMVKPDFSKITPSVIAAAMGQSFFSLSLGVGTILTYSSYVRKNEDMVLSAAGTAVMDLMFALLAGFAVMPAVFAAGLAPESGPSLIFQTLPFIFTKMGETMPLLSTVVAVLFFLTVLVAALTSAISMFEVGVAYLVEEKGLTRGWATVAIFMGTWILGALCSLSFGPLHGVHLFGNTIFDFCDKLTSNFLMTFGGLLFTVFVGWKMRRADVRDELTNGRSISFNDICFGIIYFLIKYLAPIAILVIFVTNLLA